MVTANRAQLDPLKQLLFIVKHDDFLPRELADEIRLLSGALEELENRMGTELRRSWRDLFSEAATQCKDGTSGLARGAQTV